MDTVSPASSEAAAGGVVVAGSEFDAGHLPVTYGTGGTMRRLKPSAISP